MCIKSFFYLWSICFYKTSHISGKGTEILSCDQVFLFAQFVQIIDRLKEVFTDKAVSLYQKLFAGHPNCVNAYWADVDLSHAKTLNQQFVVHTFAVKMALFMALGAENETIC